MADGVLIDSSAWIAALRARGSARVKQGVGELIQADVACTCPVVVAEVLQGARTEREYDDLADALQGLRYLPVADHDWLAAARLGYGLRRKGESIPLSDLLIASIAIRTGCPVLHLDKHFDTIARYSTLRILTITT